MALKLIAGAVQADADICNLLTVDPPKNGMHVGAGIHVVIPPDWQTRCVAGQKVVGCTYAQVESDGTMYVTDTAQANQAIPANVIGVNATALTNFRNKLALAVTVTATVAESKIVP